tara:strand:- start:1084 stop:1608 length:525 start_codon:yes stop_codon:yes gene_type:complete
MAKSNIKKIYHNFIHAFPILFLFFLAFTGFDLSFFLFENNYSFNFIYIVIFYWVLKKPDRLGYGLIFLTGIINDIVQNFPIGISSINYLLLCAIAAFIRTKTLMPNLLYDWILFFVAIIIISSVNYSILTLIFSYPIKYGTLMFSSFITFLIYPILSKLFFQINLIDLREENAE